MSKNKFSEESNELLSLGTLHEEIVEKKEQSKKLGLPIFLVVLGFTLMVVGVFFNDISKFVKTFFPKEEVKKEVKKDKSILYLECNYDKSEPTLGLSRKINIKYEFKNNLLQKVTNSNTITVIENSSDIGSSNIKLYYQRYKDAFKDFNVDGIGVSTTFNKNKLKHIIVINYQILNPANVPKSDYISISNQKDQPYRDIKEKEGKAGHICKTT